MAADTDVERRLRDELHARSITDPLPERVLTDSLTLGRRAVRRRRRQGLAGSAAVLVVVAGVVGVTVRDGSGTPDPTPSPTLTPSPTPHEEPETVAPGAWANSLSLGAPPDVPYLAGTAVILPDGTRVETGGTGAGVVGLTVAGLVLLVETEEEHPFSFSSRYVLVTDSGELRDLPVSGLVEDAAQEAVVSPDGELFTNGGDILDIRDLSVVGQVPDEADILFAWTPQGIVYGAGPRSYLWPIGGEPRVLTDIPELPNGTDVGLDGCQVVRLAPSGATTPISECILDRPRSVSPSGRWVLTEDLQLVDTTSGRSRYLAGDSVHPIPYAFDKVWWDADSSLLFPIGTQLVRCYTTTATCERATHGHELRDGVLALP